MNYDTSVFKGREHFHPCAIVEPDGSAWMNFTKAGEVYCFEAPREQWVELTKIVVESGGGYQGWLAIFRGMRQIVELSAGECMDHPWPLALKVPPRQTFDVLLRVLDGPLRVKIWWKAGEKL